MLAITNRAVGGGKGMSVVGERVGIREPRADAFETVITYQDALDARFLGSFILAMENFANSQDCTLLLDGVSEGSIKFRWKVMLAATFSASTLNLVADASQVADFMHSAWKNATEQTGEGKRTGLGKIVCRAIEDGTIESITFTQPGGEAMRIDLKNLQTDKRESALRPLDIQAGFLGSVMGPNGPRPDQIGSLVQRVEDMAADNSPDFNLEQAYQGRIFDVDGQPFFQKNSEGPLLPIFDNRLVINPLQYGKEHIVQGKFRHSHGVPAYFSMTAATAVA